MPSTTMPWMPYASAFWAIDCEAVCLRSGTVMAYWLFSQMKTLGVRHTPAKLRPLWKSVSDVEPSPK